MQGWHSSRTLLSYSNQEESYSCSLGRDKHAGLTALQLLVQQIQPNHDGPHDALVCIATESTGVAVLQLQSSGQILQRML